MSVDFVSTTGNFDLQLLNWIEESTSTPTSTTISETASLSFKDHETTKVCTTCLPLWYVKPPVYHQIPSTSILSDPVNDLSYHHASYPNLKNSYKIFPSHDHKSTWSPIPKKPLGYPLDHPLEPISRSHGHTHIHTAFTALLLYKTNMNDVRAMLLDVPILIPLPQSQLKNGISRTTQKSTC